MAKFAMKTEEADAVAEERLVTVQLIRDYVPAQTEPEVVFEEQGIGKRAKDVRSEIFPKVLKNTVIELPLTEARKCLDNGIARISSDLI
jgi:hypothetical protein